MKGKRRGRNFWYPIIKDWVDSGLSQAEYSRSKNLSPHALSNWSRKFKKEEKVDNKSLPKSEEFLEVVPLQSDSQPETPKRMLRIQTSYGSVIEVPL